MKHTFTLEVELPTRTVELDVTVDCIWENDGIGNYECWGSKYYDKGRDYLAIEDWKWDQRGFTAEEIGIVEGLIEVNLCDWETELSK